MEDDKVGLDLHEDRGKLDPCLSSLGSPMAEMQRDCPSFLMNSSPGTPLAHRQASLEPQEMKKKKNKFPFYGL